MKLKKLHILMVFIFFIFGVFTTNTTYAIKRKDVPRVLNHVIQTKLKDPIKKDKILQKKKVKDFLYKFHAFSINSYVYRVILNRDYSNYQLLKKTDGTEQLSFEVNRLKILHKEQFEKKKEEIRTYLIKEMFKRNILKFDDEIQNFYIDTNLKGELTVKQIKQTTKRDLLSEMAENLLNLEINKLKPLKESINELDRGNYTLVNRVIYYNFLYDNNIKKEIYTDLDWNKLKNTLVIRDANDFKKLFKVTSYRYRSSYAYDTYYRRYNIKQIYDTIPGNKMVLYPKQTISFNSIYLKGDNGTKFKKGSIIKNGEVQEGVYGGGVCGAATGMYQGTIWNKYIKTNARPHSIWYNMYRASINGEKIYTPGLDATYFTNVIDLKLTNTGEYPIIFINRIVDNIEENFTLSTTFVKDDKIKSLKFNFRSNLNYDDKEKKRTCFSWSIDGKTKRSCYKKIASEEKVKVNH